MLQVVHFPAQEVNDACIGENRRSPFVALLNIRTCLHRMPRERKPIRPTHLGWSVSDLETTLLLEVLMSPVGRSMDMWLFCSGRCLIQDAKMRTLRSTDPVAITQRIPAFATSSSFFLFAALEPAPLALSPLIGASFTTFGAHLMQLTKWLCASVTVFTHLPS